MGTKYESEAISGYNSAPPVDDGTQSEANKVKWATTKDKLSDPLKTQVENIDTKLVAMADVGPDAKIIDYTTLVGDHQKTIEVTAAAVTITLLAIASAPSGYTITVKNSSASTTIIDATGSETIDGSTGSIMLADDEVLVVQLNQAEDGYIVLQQPDSTIISSAQVYKGDAAGTADVITVSLTPTLTALTDGTVCFVKAFLANATTTPTINFDSLGAKTITKEGSQALVAGDIARLDHELILRYNAGNTEWELLNPVTASAIADSIVTLAKTSGSLITSDTAIPTTSGTSHPFTGIPSWAKKITIMFNGNSTNGTSFPMVQIGDSGGIEPTGYLGSAGRGASFNNFTTGFQIDNGTNSASIIHGSMTLSLLEASTNTWICSATGGLSNQAFTFTTGGSKSLSGTLTQLLFTTVNGTDVFDAGSVNILYE